MSAKKFAAEVKRVTEFLAEPEKSIAIALNHAVQAATSAFPSHEVVKVTASGSQSDPYYGNQDRPKVSALKINSASLMIEPIYGFEDYFNHRDPIKDDQAEPKDEAGPAPKAVADNRGPHNDAE